MSARFAMILQPDPNSPKNGAAWGAGGGIGPSFFFWIAIKNFTPTKENEYLPVL